VLTLALLWSGANAQCDGSCQTNSESCSGSYKSGLCPGSSSVECCVEVCLYIFSDHSLCVCVLFFLLEHHLLYITSFALYIYQHTHTHTHKTTSSCNGQCQSTNAGLTCAGSYVAGLCPGSSNIECCVGTVPFADRYIHIINIIPSLLFSSVLISSHMLSHLLFHIYLQSNFSLCLSLHKRPITT
jgi:hypothetical protein